MLTETMLKIKSDLEDMQLYLYKNCKLSSARNDLLGVVSRVRDSLDIVDSHIIRGEYSSAFHKIADHFMPRKKDYYIRRNYDYGEFWPAVLDAYRDGKIKDVVEMSRKLKRWPEQEDEPVKRPNEKHIDTKIDNPDKKQKELLSRAQEESLLFLDSYCDKEKNIEYWSQMKDDDEYNEAVEDFINYIKEVKC